MRIQRRLAGAGRGSATASLLLMAAVALSACEGGIVVSPSDSPASPAASAMIGEVTWPEPAPFAGPPVTGYSCAGRPYLTPGFDIVITASRTVHLEHVTLRMLDGSSLGGPMVAFPQAGLASEFGSTLVGAGHSRRFRFHPRFPCAGAARGFAADLSLVDLGGATHALTVSSWPR